MNPKASHEQSSRARAPLATLALALVCVTCFFAARGQQPLWGEPEHVELEHAVDFWKQHPYLEPHAAVLESASGANGGLGDPTAWLAGVRRRGAQPPADAESRDQEQAELAYMTGLALRGSDAEPGPLHPFTRFGLVPAQPRAQALVAHPFLHAGWLQLALTLLLLALAGPALEAALGSLALLGLFLACALAGAAAQLGFASGSTAPFVGATAALAGVVGALLGRNARGELGLRLFELRGVRLRARTVSAPVWLLLPFCAAAQIALALSWDSAHVVAGGALGANACAAAFGAAVALGLRRLRFEERRGAAVQAARTTAKLDPRLKRSTTARDRGQHDEAIALAAAVLRERPEDPQALLADWQAHVAAGRAGDGARSARRLIELHARRGELAPAARLWDELVRVAHRGRVEPTTLLRIVPELVVQARRDAAVAALRNVVDASHGPFTVGQALRVAELASELDPPTALRAARFALEHGELVEERRARLEQLVLTLENSGVRLKDAPAAPPEAAYPRTAEPTGALLSEPDPAEQRAEEPPAAPEELFELEPTQLGGDEPKLAPPAPAPPPPAAFAAPVPERRPARGEEAVATVLYNLPPATRATFASIKVTPGVPVALEPEGLRLRLEGGAPSLLGWERVQAVGVGLVSGVSQNPVVVIDLALNWADGAGDALELIRLRSDGFRARQLITGSENAVEALRALLAALLARSGAVPLPDPAGARGTPFREFAEPEAYERAVLLANG